MADHLVELIAPRPKKKEEGGSVRVRGNGAHRREISIGAQFNAVISPSEQHGVLAEIAMEVGAFPPTPNGHVNPLLQTVRFCAIIEVEDERAPLVGREEYASQFPHRRFPPPAVFPDLAHVPIMSRFAHGDTAFIRIKTIVSSVPIMGACEWIYAFAFCRAGAVLPLVSTRVVLTVVWCVKGVVWEVAAAIPPFLELKKALGFVVRTPSSGT